MAFSRRQLINGALSGLAAGALLPPAVAAQPGQREARSVPMIDGLGFPGSASADENAPLSAMELSDIHNTGLAATHLTVGAVGTMTPLAAFEQLVRDVMRWELEIQNNPEVLARVRSADDILVAANSGKTGLIYGLQDGVAFEDDPGRLTALAQLGIRIVQPTYNRRNLLGDGCMEPADAGLSQTGMDVVEQLNELRLLIDLSHCGRRTAADAIGASARPVAFTHTGCDALAPHPRHRSDAEMRAVADTGGVIGIFVMPYLARGKQPTAADVIRHLEHAIDIAGEDHVAIGTDGALSPVQLTPEYIERFRDSTRKRAQAGIAAPYETETGYLFASDLNEPDRFATLADRLRQRGHGAARIDKILGANLLRLFRDSW